MDFFFFNDTATTEIYTLSLHDALPISTPCSLHRRDTNDCAKSGSRRRRSAGTRSQTRSARLERTAATSPGSEKTTSEPQCRQYLVCRLLLLKKNNSLSSICAAPSYYCT